MIVKLAVVGAVLLVPGAVALAGDDQGRPVFRQEGRASIYGNEAQGKRTASGERFDQRKPLAAHRTLPLGSEATVKSRKTGKRVRVKVVDRGPTAPGRAIDLSMAAARRLGIAEEGVAPVEIEATKGQVERAIGGPQEAPRVEKQLGEARREAAREGTPQPEPVPKLDPPRR